MVVSLQLFMMKDCIDNLLFLIICFGYQVFYQVFIR